MSIEPRAASGSVGRRDKVIALNLVGAVAPVSDIPHIGVVNRLEFPRLRKWSSGAGEVG